MSNLCIDAKILTTAQLHVRSSLAKCRFGKPGFNFYIEDQTMLGLSRIIVSLFLSLTLVLCQFSSPALAQEDLSGIDFKVKVPDNMLENLLLQSGIHPGDSSKEVFINNAVITLHNPRLGKTSSVGELRTGTGDTIQFRARQPLRFAPDTADTSVTFGTLMDRGDDTAEFVVFTGRWINFFGVRICPGQAFHLPGES